MRADGRKCPDQRDDLPGRVPLEGHHGQPDDIRLEFRDQSLERRANGPLREDEVGDRDPVMRIEVAGQGPQGAIRHPHRHRGRVLE